MELNGLRILIERASALHDEISDRIKGSSTDVSFCRFCFEQGQYCCGFSETTSLEEREGLVAIRDSLKNVENMLQFLQKMNSLQRKDRSEALARLEESRLTLMEKVARYRGRGALSVLEELSSYFAEVETARGWNLKKIIENLDETKLPLSQKEITYSHPLIRSLKCLLCPWSWHRMAIKFVLVSASISLVSNWCRGRQGCQSSDRRSILPFVGCTGAERSKVALTGPLDVFHGRG
ncbi:hypothetical protein NMG60_11022772 [Bertholletia excelsa]